MKTPIIAAATLTLCASSACASNLPIVCSYGSPETMVNNCSTSDKDTSFVSLYIAGSSALGSALGTVLAANLFDTSNQPVITLNYTDEASPNAGQVSGWYGFSHARVTGGVSKRLFVVYNQLNGSGAGVSQLLSMFDGRNRFVEESFVLSVGPVNGVAGRCTTDDSSSAFAPVLNCPTSALLRADMALSDVAPAELSKLYKSATRELSTLVSTPLAMQGFGLAVSADLYASLQAAQDTSGQPSIRRSDYAALVTGKIKSAGALIPGSKDAITLVRGNDLSGTQAASNIFFANNACGRNHDANGKLIAGLPGGAQPIVGAADSNASLTVLERAVDLDVIMQLNGSGKVIGAVSLTTAKKYFDTWQWVKLNGVAPDVDSKNRGAFAKGDYQWAVTSFAVTYAKPVVDKSGLINAVISGLQDSSLHDLAGIAYLDGVVTAKQSQVERPDSNNCAPLVRKL